MVLWGTIINAVAIICGAILGSVFTRISDGIRTTVMQGIGIAVGLLGLTMALKTENFLILIFSVVIGGILGELIRLDHWLNELGQWIERRVGGKGKGNIATGFVTATLVYCVGAMAILGAMDSGLRNNHDILYTKSMLDGFSAIIFTSTLGIGVMFSAIPVFLYQGLIAIASTFISVLVSQEMLEAIIAEITAVGGILIIGIGINVLEIKKINVANLLPAIVVAALMVPLISKTSQLFG
ncbi:DUF554 domain-containing protein [Ammoniphilus sp. CFH 90114]|uniref:DUF554 domain-containing protein n=1 Tax=Ammoniphilus sp. CFH 90114 TaxID=2493665 RepID=UPI00100FCF8E|nr:DUF554 domain-containing protein [Ammoniphilus sp. CFH 90114]RXT09120.1 DUF554 domain-containing protein [Ammoniphilus sp. CFH 90114]